MASTDPPPLPDFITFLFSEKPTFDCHFIVGDKNLVEPERIGAVKIMLMAHSEVFRNQLEDSQLKEKEIAIKDMYPDTFKALLKFVYGYDTTGDLEFDMADNMFYVAEKYLMATLKNKLATRLMTLLTPDNVCSLLNNPAISTHLALNSHITHILRQETDKVLMSLTFPEVNLEGFLQILQQDALAATEIELWRAAMKWAKHKAGSEDGQVLRQQLGEATKHLRICSFTAEQFCQEVGPLGVLNCNEVQLAVTSVGKKGKCEELTEFSNEIEPRKKLRSNLELIKCDGDCGYSCSDRSISLVCRDKFGSEKNFSFVILTKKYAIDLVHFKCLSWTDCRKKEIDVSCKINITELRQQETCKVSTSSFSKEVKCGTSFDVKLADGCHVRLPPNKKYKISISNIRGFVSYRFFYDVRYEDEHIVLSFSGSKDPSYCPASSLCYKVLMEERQRKFSAGFSNII